jgi:hypothetical protein
MGRWQDEFAPSPYRGGWFGLRCCGEISSLVAVVRGVRATRCLLSGKVSHDIVCANPEGVSVNAAGSLPVLRIFSSDLGFAPRPREQGGLKRWGNWRGVALVDPDVCTGSYVLPPPWQATACGAEMTAWVRGGTPLPYLGEREGLSVRSIRLALADALEKGELAETPLAGLEEEDLRWVEFPSTHSTNLPGDTWVVVDRGEDKSPAPGKSWGRTLCLPRFDLCDLGHKVSQFEEALRARREGVSDWERILPPRGLVVALRARKEGLPNWRNLLPEVKILRGGDGKGLTRESLPPDGLPEDVDLGEWLDAQYARPPLTSPSGPGSRPAQGAKD